MLKPLNLTDIDAIYAIERKNYPFPWSKKLITQQLESKMTQWGIWDKSQLVGYSFLQYMWPEAELLNISIAPMSQRQNMGYLLLNKLITELKNAKFERLYLEVRKSNKGAQKLYERSGFNLIGERLNYYRTTTGREDALLYALEIL